MTLLEALKVSRGACVKFAFHLEEIGADSGSILEIEEAAAVLARLEEELPKLLSACAEAITDLGLHEWARGDQHYGANLQAALNRLDAAPKEGS